MKKKKNHVHYTSKKGVDAYSFPLMSTHAEHELLQSKQRLDALMNALPIGVTFSSDVTCEYITGNPTLARQLEIHPGDNISASTSDVTAVGRKLKHFINGREITGWEMPMQRSIAEGKEIGPIEIEVELVSGRRWFMEAIGAPIRDTHGEVIAAVAVNVDLTERKRAAEADRLEILIDQEKSKIGFIADATHELRTPLAIIKGNIDLALRNITNPDDPMKSSLLAMDNEVMHLTNLLADLTLLTTTGADFQRRVGSQKVQIKEMITTLATRHKAFARKNNVTIELKGLPNVVIEGDEQYLEKLFSNIIRNAIIYCKEKGLVTIQGRRTDKDIIVEITDNGIGIAENDLPHIFERFYRTDRSRSKDTGGTGLGLSIVKWIAEAHRGTVTAQSTLDEGSSFTITLPLIKSSLR